MSKSYEAPALRQVGSVHALTQQQTNKVGVSADATSEVIQNLINDGTVPPNTNVPVGEETPV